MGGGVAFALLSCRHGWSSEEARTLPQTPQQPARHTKKASQPGRGSAAASARHTPKTQRPARYIAAPNRHTY
ncbi:uncharacterized protein BKA78DRAFT_309020 [Phyllosticta capitalensis]|uniref:uncharacterized protein n=1 Tax=Phyllosticta capitalensis TaxID=121624 RepID=UPI00312FC212